MRCRLLGWRSGNQRRRSTREPPRIFTLQRWRAGRRRRLRLHHQPDPLRRRVGRLLPRPRLHLPRYINHLLTRRRARQRFQREASAAIRPL